MTSEEYGQYIDDFELDVDVMPGESLTEYIERRRREFESKADGGSIGIEVLFKPKREDFSIGGRAQRKVPYDSRATAQDFANALKSVSAGTTYQQQADAQRYAKNKANEMLTAAMRSGNQGNIQSILQGIGGRATIPGLQFSMSGNRITGVPATGPGRDRILNAMAQQMLSTTNYGTIRGGSSIPMQKSPLQLKIEENQRIYDEFIKNRPAPIGILTGPQGGAPTPPKPEYEDQALLSKLTMLTPEEAFAGETFDTLSDLDQYNFAQAFTQFQPQRRDPTYVSPYGAPSGREIFARRYGIKDGGKVTAAPSQLVSESDILLGYRGDDAARSDRASGRSAGRADPSGGVDRSAVGAGSQYARNVAAQKNKPSFKQKVKSVVTNPGVQTLGGAVLTGGINLAFPGAIDKLNKARMIANVLEYAQDTAIEDELENIPVQGGIVPYAKGGRVGLFMGGPALEGQALSIYNSMSAYGFSDQEIANALAERGLYTPGGTTEETGIIASAPNIINQQTGDDGPSTPPGPTFNKDDLLGTSDYQGTGPGFIESILGIPAALVNAYTKISPINFVKSIFKPNVERINKINIDAVVRAEEERKAKAAAERAAFLAEQQRTNIASQLGGPDGQSGGKYAGGDAFASANPYGGSGTMDDLGADTFKEGGLATMFTRRR